MRCCVYKERAIVSERIKLATGGDPLNPNVIEVIDIACDECPVGAKGLCENRNRALARGGAHGEGEKGGTTSAGAGKAGGKTGGAPVGNNGKTDGKTEGKKTP